MPVGRVAPSLSSGAAWRADLRPEAEDLACNRAGLAAFPGPSKTVKSMRPALVLMLLVPLAVAACTFSSSSPPPPAANTYVVPSPSAAR
jgi:hypothetical protein